MFLLKKYREIKLPISAINWNRSWKEEEIFLLKLKLERAKKPDEGIYDSITQYKAQNYGVSVSDAIALHLLSFIAFPFVFFKSISRRVIKSEKRDAAYFSRAEIFPKTVQNTRSIIFIGNDDFKLRIEDIKFLWRVLIISRFNWIILSAVTFRIARIRYAIEAYGIKEVWANMEYSCACGAVHDFCIQNHLVLKNFMHGEKLLNIRDTFTRFHELYVWNNHYKEILETLLVRADKIIIANPWELEEKKEPSFESKKICYFLNGRESPSEIEIIDRSLRAFKNKGYEIYYKKHPRQPNKYSLSKDYLEYSQFNEIKDLYIFDYVISEYSTVLFQCYCNNQAVILNDLSNPERVKQLQERNYIFLNKNFNVPALSRFI